ncbi:hypothetical protein JB92DRAFT_594664 [Gautieria morchelliformis]|nr:hypothetical protein JB92DRAFT_594664 [Gautieria morchelliformis]
MSSALQRSQSRIPLSPPSRVSSAPLSLPSIRLPGAGESVVSVPTTPATSRMSTRSSTASQSKGKTPLNDTQRAKDSETVSPLRPEKRALRSSRVPPHVEDGKEQPVSPSQGLSIRQGRQARRSLASAPSTPANSGKIDIKRLYSSGSKIHTNKCHTCASELRHLIKVKSPKNAVHSCARCKRHFAIFSAPWPIRNATSEALSSTTSSSDSSSNETAIEIAHENPKDGSPYGHNKLKHSKKYVDAKHASTERPVKCRKTDSILFAKVAYHHRDAQPRKASGEFGVLKKGKYLGYAHKFTVPGGAQRSRANRALNREATKGLGSLPAPMVSKPGWDNALGDKGDRGLDQVCSRKRPWDDSDDLAGTLTIRRVGSLPALPVAKPLAALCAGPSPNAFARNAWAASPFKGNHSADEDLMETSSDLTDLTESEHIPAPKSSPNSVLMLAVTPDQSGQKRKRESVATDRKRMGRSFYMKDEKKRMPKGWVLVTDSSEETGEDEDSAEARKSDELPSGTAMPPPQAIGVDQAADSPVSGLDSGSGSTPTLVHTPSSRATSTPTQSSGTLVDDQATTSVVAKRVTYSLRKNATAGTPTTVQSPKRRKLSDEIDTSPSQPEIRHISVNQVSVRSSEGYDRSQDQAENTGLKPDVSVDDPSRDSSALLAPKNSSGDHDADKEVLREHEKT